MTYFFSFILLAFCSSFVSHACEKDGGDGYLPKKHSLRKFVEQDELHHFAYQLRRYSQDLSNADPDDSDKDYFCNEVRGSWRPFKLGQIAPNEMKGVLGLIIDVYDDYLKPAHILRAKTLGLITTGNSVWQKADSWFGPVSTHLLKIAASAFIINTFALVPVAASFPHPLLKTSGDTSPGSHNNLMSPQSQYGCYEGPNGPECQLNSLGFKSLTPELPGAQEATLISESFKSIIEFLKVDDAKFEKVALKGEAQIPVFDSIKVIHSFYESQENCKIIGGGSQNIILEQTLNHPRENAGRGTKIALRLNNAKQNPAPNRFTRQLQAYALLSPIRDLQISDYIPRLYGVYYAPHQAFESYLSKIHKNTYPIRYSAEDMVRCIEMELVDGPSYEDKGVDKHIIEARVLVEELIGRWAVKRIAGISIEDPDGDVWRHHLLQKCDYYAVYHVGNDSYIFKPGYSPRQIDYDDFHLLQGPEILSEEKKFSSLCEWSYETKKSEPDYWYMRRLNSQQLKEFMISMCAGNGLFASLQCLTDYKVSNENPIPTTSNVRHYYIPNDYLND